jgi:hypothetical protein
MGVNPVHGNTLFLWKSEIENLRFSFSNFIRKVKKEEAK